MRDQLLEDLADARAEGESERILKLLNMLAVSNDFLEDSVVGTLKSKPTRAVKVSDAGWYQNSDGKLFHYDGVVWDEVPNEKQEDLEFLG